VQFQQRVKPAYRGRRNRPTKVQWPGGARAWGRFP
jgi:hypothetical protein